MTTIMRIDPFREMTSLQAEMSRMLNSVFENGGRTAPAKGWIPPLDVWETDEEVVYAFDLPGIPEDSISVEVEDGALTVSAERERSAEVKDERFYRVERHFGRFERTIALPQGVADADVKASCENGVLEIHVPKPEQPKPRRIPVGKGDKAVIEA